MVVCILCTLRFELQSDKVDLRKYMLAVSKHITGAEHLSICPLQQIDSRGNSVVFSFVYKDIIVFCEF